MAVRANKPAFNIREKLKELTHSIGLKGRELMSATTTQEARDLVSAGRKNLIINGAMMINQRYTGSATVTDDFVLDRFKFKENHGGAASINRDAFPVSDNHPAGFRYAMQVACSTADTSLTSNEHSVIMHMVEGYNIGGTKFGTPNAESMTLSFWVKTNAPGTYSVALKNGSQNRCQIKEYQVGSGGYVWEKVVLTYSGCNDGTWNDDIDVGMKLEFGLAGGQSSYATGDLNRWKTSNLFLSSNQRNFFDNTNNRFFITGIQLEVGKNATDFEHRSYGEELALCQRYFQKIGKSGHGGLGKNDYLASGFVGSNGSEFYGGANLKVTMRASPTISVNGTASHLGYTHPGVAFVATGLTSYWSNPQSYAIRISGTGSGTTGYGAYARITDDATQLEFNAEL